MSDSYAKCKLQDTPPVKKVLPRSTKKEDVDLSRLRPHEMMMFIFLVCDSVTDADLASFNVETGKKIFRNWLDSNQKWIDFVMDALYFVKLYIHARKSSKWVPVDLLTQTDLQSYILKSKFIHPLKFGLFIVAEEISQSNKEALLKRIQNQEAMAFDTSMDLKAIFFKMMNAGFIKIHSQNIAIETFANHLAAVDRELYHTLMGIHLRFKSIPKEASNSNVFKVLDKNKIGFFMIINNRNFDDKLGPRCPTNADVEKLTECWSKVGFQVVTHNDLTSEGILVAINTTLDKVNWNHSAFGLCILSHGDEGKVYGADGQLVPVQSIVKCLEIKKIEATPKILIGQTCSTRSFSKPIVSAAENSNILSVWVNMTKENAYTGESPSKFIHRLCTEVGEKGRLYDMKEIITNISMNGLVTLNFETVDTLTKNFKLS